MNSFYQVTSSIFKVLSMQAKRNKSFPLKSRTAFYKLYTIPKHQKEIIASDHTLPLGKAPEVWGREINADAFAFEESIFLHITTNNHQKFFSG